MDEISDKNLIIIFSIIIIIVAVGAFYFGTKYSGNWGAASLSLAVPSSVVISGNPASTVANSNSVNMETNNTAMPASTASAKSATNVSTGLTNNFFTDSFFLPLLVIIGGLWFYLSGGAYGFADKLKSLLRK